MFREQLLVTKLILKSHDSNFILGVAGWDVEFAVYLIVRLEKGLFLDSMRVNDVSGECADKRLHIKPVVRRKRCLRVSTQGHMCMPEPR